MISKTARKHLEAVGVEMADKSPEERHAYVRFLLVCAVAEHRTNELEREIEAENARND